MVIRPKILNKTRSMFAAGLYFVWLAVFMYAAIMTYHLYGLIDTPSFVDIKANLILKFSNHDLFASNLFSNDNVNLESLLQSPNEVSAYWRRQVIISLITNIGFGVFCGMIVSVFLCVGICYIDMRNIQVVKYKLERQERYPS